MTDNLLGLPGLKKKTDSDGSQKLTKKSAGAESGCLANESKIERKVFA